MVKPSSHLQINSTCWHNIHKAVLCVCVWGGGCMRACMRTHVHVCGGDGRSNISDTKKVYMYYSSQFPCDGSLSSYTFLLLSLLLLIILHGQLTFNNLFDVDGMLQFLHVLFVGSDVQDASQRLCPLHRELLPHVAAQHKHTTTVTQCQGTQHSNYT